MSAQNKESIMKTTALTRRLLAGAAALTLSFGVVACADDGDSAGETTATETTATTTDEEATEATTPSVDADAEALATGEDVMVETAEGTVGISAAAAAALEEFTAGWGTPETIENNDVGQVLAIYPEGNLAVFSEETGAVPVGGEIANEWLDGGGLENSIGLPTAPEADAPEGNGQVQEFTNGTISWLADEDGEFSIDVQEDEN
ncbi:hypothetical protein NYP18_03700 [Corynebacterium sp. YIM 101645]|uniref:LGFP repeat-containing protein n=1 Tax=Corynebacterium lemuris TaxID=1859292 RepID=A0ABT2FU52_9CORY|nr:hypothetical protein [Corynebacterium lemuris]MCS5478754.1 hypothetical protein [Corynebacterium lemuris]